jgi:glycosyltransferase involved in cell wall biosynthesis
MSPQKRSPGPEDPPLTTMKVSVILCTYNRCHLLAKALQSVALSKLPASVDWEVLVVDNNSKDQTREVIEDCSRRFPGRFQYVFEAQQGKSFALNRGIHDAQGDVLAFMDDDVYVDPEWLHTLTANLDQGQWAGSGGRIILEWPAETPRWFAREGPFARHGFPGFDQGNEAKELVGPPFGTNMAFRKEVFVRYGGFRVDLGPSPTNEIRAEDTEFGRRVLSAGEHLRYEPAAIVHHPVFTAQINKKRLLQWWFDNGRATAREFSTKPVHSFCSFVSWSARWITSFSPPARFHHKLVVWEKAGMLSEFSRQFRHSERQDLNATKESKTECKI